MSNRARVLVTVAMTTVLVACGTAAPSGSHPASASAEPTESSPLEPAVATSETLIADALARGEIDYPTSLLYRVYAAFGADELPAPYRSDVIDTHAATFAFKEIDKHAAEMPAEVVTAVAPYLARPNDPDSIFMRPGPIAQVGTEAPGTPLKPVGKWYDKPAAGGKARVWTADREVPDDLVNAVNRVWPKVFSLTREPNPDEPGLPLASVNPDAAIDLYFVDLGTIDPRVWACHTNPASPNCTSKLTKAGGYTRDAKPWNGPVSSSYSVIEATATGAQLDSNIAHELTHTSQNTYDRFEGPWLLDSTATWAAYRTLQLLGTKPEPAYEYLSDFFKTLDEPLTRADEPYRYGSWLYFFSLQIDYGDRILPTIFEKMAAEPVQNAGAVNDAFRFEGNFGKFAVSNWHRDTADRYKADTQFPAEHQAEVDYPRRQMSPGDHQLEFATGYLSADYASYSFTDDVHKVVVDNPFTSALAECKCVPELWLIPKVKGVWQQPQQLTAAKREFCFDKPDQDLDELVLIVANTSWTESPPLTTGMMPTIHALEEGCACPSEASGWTGTLAFSYDAAGGGAEVHRSAEITLNLDEVYIDEEDAKSWTGDYTGGSAAERDSYTSDNVTNTVIGGPISRGFGDLVLDKMSCTFMFSFVVTITSTYHEFDQTFESDTTVGDITLWDIPGGATVKFDGTVAAHVMPGEPGESMLFLVSGGQIHGGYEFELSQAVGEAGLGDATVQLTLTATD